MSEIFCNLGEREREGERGREREGERERLDFQFGVDITQLENRSLIRNYKMSKKFEFQEKSCLINDCSVIKFQNIVLTTNSSLSFGRDYNYFV